MEQKPTVAVLTLGCKVNQYESEAIAEAFAAAGFSVCSAEEPCDVYVINTCTVTAESDRKDKQLIRRMHQKNPRARILVTGCLAQVDPAAVAAIKGVDDVCGNTDKLSVVRRAEELLRTPPAAPTCRVADIHAATFEPMRITTFERTRAYIKIEDGCENHCTYCAIPGARGRVRSKAPEDILSEVRALTRNGCKEVVLTGIETASFGRDLEGYSLADLLTEVDRIPGIGRVRLGSLDPSLMKKDFVDRIAGLSSLAPHFHLSMQSGSSAVLAAMKRKYNAKQALEGILRLRAAIPRVQLTTDFIVGFPGETEEDFAATMEFARQARFLQMHVFAYSKRAGTPAASFPDQVPAAVKKARSAALIRLGEELRATQLQNALCEPRREVLFESFENGFAIGHTADFLEVAAKSDRPLHSELHLVQLTAAHDGRLYGNFVR